MMFERSGHDNGPQTNYFELRTCIITTQNSSRTSQIMFEKVDISKSWNSEISVFGEKTRGKKSLMFV